MKPFIQFVALILIFVGLLGCKSQESNSTNSDNNSSTQSATDTQSQINTYTETNSQNDTQTDTQMIVDSDSDGVEDASDLCPQTRLDLPVNSNGCALNQLDEDQDLVIDALDKCSETTLNALVNEDGCALYQLDSDNDGVNDSIDMCAETHVMQSVDINGCSQIQLDIDFDEDNVLDAIDQCLNTQIGLSVDENGCAQNQLDSDFDGVMNSKDLCLNTLSMLSVDVNGCAQNQLDDDQDTISNDLDQCIETPLMQNVNDEGCSLNQLDDDQDGVKNDIDQCANTQSMQMVDNNGCSINQIDSDNDGVLDVNDQCSNTVGMPVLNGCSQAQLDAMIPIDDADSDGIQDSDDYCAMTIIGASVTDRGCSDLQEGAFVYAEKCSNCHGDNGQGGREIQIQNCTFDDLDCTNFEDLRRYNSNAMPKFNDNSCRNDCAIWVTTYSIDAFVIFENDDDKDNVKNNLDQCPNTLWFNRNEVLENGCTTQNSNVNAQVVEYFINVGGAAFVATNGDEYQEDDYFLNGNADSTNEEIENTTNDALYKTNRWAKNLSYDLPIKNGDYEVSLSFAETHFIESQKRQFNVLIEGLQRELNFDIFEESGKINRAKTKKYNVTVSDEFLTIELNASENNALLSAIKVVESVEDSNAPIDYSQYKKGMLVYSENFEDGDITPWDFGKAENGVYKVWKIDDGSHAQTARLYTKSDNEYVPPKTQVDIFPEHITNAIIEFDYKALKYTDPQTNEEYGPPSVNFVIDDKHSSSYTHAGHISRVSVYSSGKVLMRDDVGGAFGKRQAEKIIKERDGDTAKYNEIVAQYYNDDILKTKQVNADAGILPNVWVNIRIVMYGPRMEFWVDDELITSLNSPGLLDVNNPIEQPVKAFAESFGRTQLQPRGLDHYKNKFGFTVNPGQIHVDNVKIWKIEPL